MHDHSDDEESEWPDFIDVDDDEDIADEPEKDNADEPYDFEDMGLPHQRNQDYCVLKAQEIRKLQEDDITKVSTLLSIPNSDACCLLHHFNWSVSGISDEWFADEDGVREKVGLLTKPLAEFNARDSITCGICFDDYLGGSESVLSAVCGHPFCKDCWTGYITTSIKDGPRCLRLKCPEPNCVAAVSPDLISMLTTEEDNERYKHFFLRSYVEGRQKEIKWCPSPDCEHAVKLDSDACLSYDVFCLCSHSFCWNCTEEIHRPVDCETVEKWISKNKDESENAKWILVNTKPCPKCKKPIEKNQGCNNMTCLPPCGYRFCWYCLEKSIGHRCNAYRPESGAKNDEGEDERHRKRVKRDLERYLHYYERWATNLSSKRKAVEDLNKVESVHSKKLVQTQQIQLESELKFVVDAWKQIIQCRQVLRWTYAYGYFMPEEEKVKVNLFEFLQGQAESSLERLHKCAETELKEFLMADGPEESFLGFRMKLLDLTRLSANHFDQLLSALENGLSDVASVSNGMDDV